MTRLHVGCGTVWLDGYRNVDVPSPRCYLATERPDLVDRYRTTADAYYARHAKHDAVASFNGPPEAAEYVCDAYGRWDALPCRDGDASEVLSRASFEHLSASEAAAALHEARRVLRPGGRLRLSVPDHAASLARFIETSDPVFIRLLVGPRTGPGGYHLMSYTRDGLRALVAAHGFMLVDDEPNPHAYPMICLEWVRA